MTKFVTVFYEPTSYIWRLMKMLEENPSPRFDFCYIDGAHDWATDGFAFFLVDTLLRPGGLIIFDDLDWTYESSTALSNTEKVRLMPRRKARVRFGKFTSSLRRPIQLMANLWDEWAYARKTAARLQGIANEVRKEVVYQREYVGLGGAILKILRKLAG